MSIKRKVYVDVPKRIGDVTGEPTGFPNRTDSDISFNDGNIRFTIQPTGDFFEFYSLGKKFRKTSSESIDCTDTEGLWFFYYETDGVLTCSQTPWDFFSGKVFISYGYWDATNSSWIGQGEERHGLVMDAADHEHFHNYFGSLWKSGITPSVTVDGGGSSNADAEIQLIGAGIMADEDIIFNHPEQTSYEIWYKDGANANWRKTVASAAAVYTLNSGVTPYWNEFTGGAWQLTNVTNTRFTLTHLFATDDINMPYILIMGENEYLTNGAAQDGATNEIATLTSGALPVTEFIPIATFIVQCRTSYTNDYNAQLVSTADGGDFIDFRESEKTGVGATTNHHGNLTGLTEDDHPQYMLVDGTRTMISYALRTETSDYTITSSDWTILADATSNTVTITLPASPNQGQVFNIKCIDSTNTCTIARNGNNIDGTANDINIVATDSVTMQFDTAYGWSQL